jgi:hypothetical protein
MNAALLYAPNLRSRSQPVATQPSSASGSSYRSTASRQRPDHAPGCLILSQSVQATRKIATACRAFGFEPIVCRSTEDLFRVQNQERIRVAFIDLGGRAPSGFEFMCEEFSRSSRLQLVICGAAANEIWARGLGAFYFASLCPLQAEPLLSAAASRMRPFE